jgi:single-strand DNA-binding protein
MNINKVQIAGRLTKDPEVKHTPQGVSIADFSLAVNRFWKDAQGANKEEVDFIDVTAYGRTAETISKHLRKGREVYIEGRLKLDKWEKDGQARSKLGVIADSMQFVGAKPEQPHRTKPAPDFSKPPRGLDPDLDGEPDDIPI